MKAKSLVATIAAMLLTTALTTVALAHTPAAEDRDLRAAIAAPHRDAANSARDIYRHPYETLQFFGLKPDMTVVEVWPGAGWYSEILASYLRANGRYYAASFDAGSGNYFRDNLAKYQQKLSASPELYDRVQHTTFHPPQKLELAPAGSADLVLTFRNIHNWYMRGGGDEQMRLSFAAFFTALKKGGVLGVVEHRLPAARPASDMESSGYMHQAYVIAMAEQAGFKLLAQSEINANPKDDANHIVWALPPTFAMKEQDREKYAAIGESDRMTLKFVKP